jgi:hypothetical protein
MGEELDEGTPEFYLHEGQRAREFASRTRYSSIRADLLKIAEQYEVMARHVERLRRKG